MDLVLPANILFTLFDRSANLTTALKRHLHSGSMLESSLMLGFELQNVGG